MPPLGRDREREGEKSVTVSIAIAKPCDAGLVHPTLTAPSFRPQVRLHWLLATSLLVPEYCTVGTQAASLSVCPSALHFTHVPNP